MDMESKGVTSNTRYGLVATDSVTNILKVIPIENRTPEEMSIGLNNNI